MNGKTPNPQQHFVGGTIFLQTISSPWKDMAFSTIVFIVESCCRPGCTIFGFHCCCGGEIFLYLFPSDR